jgi:hypothetical protein
MDVCCQDSLKVAVGRSNRIVRRGELHALATKFDDLLDNLLHCAFAAAENAGT